MNSELTFIGTLSLQETLDMDRYRLNYVFRPLYRCLLYFMAGFFLIMGIFRLIYYEFSFFPVLLLFGSLYALFGWRIERKYRIKKEFKKYEHDDRPTTVRLNEENIYMKNKLMEATFEWDVIKTLINAPGGILIQITRHQNLFYLPSYLFKNNNKRQKIIKLFELKKIPIKTIS